MVDSLALSFFMYPLILVNCFWRSEVILMIHRLCPSSKRACGPGLGMGVFVGCGYECIIYAAQTIVFLAKLSIVIFLLIWCRQRKYCCLDYLNFHYNLIFGQVKCLPLQFLLASIYYLGTSSSRYTKKKKNNPLSFFFLLISWAITKSVLNMSLVLHRKDTSCISLEIDYQETMCCNRTNQLQAKV